MSYRATSAPADVVVPTAGTLDTTLPAGTADAPPLKLTTGTNTTVPQQGAFEFNGTNLSFTRSAARETVITASAVNTVSPTSPNRTVTINIGGVTLYLAAKTTND